MQAPLPAACPSLGDAPLATVVILPSRRALVRSAAKTVPFKFGVAVSA